MAFFQDLMVDNGYVSAEFFSLSTEINMGQEDATLKVMDLKTFWMPLSFERAVVAQVLAGTYCVITDTNFLPWR